MRNLLPCSRMAMPLAIKTSRSRRVFCSLFFITAVVAAVGGVAPTLAVRQRVVDNAFHQKIAPWVMEHTANGQQSEFFVVLVDQADLSRANTLQTKAEKGRYVYNSLFNKSETTQRPVLQWLG